MEFMFRLVNHIKNIGNILSRTILISFPTNHSCFSVNHFNHPGVQFQNRYSDNKFGNRGNEIRMRGKEFRMRGNEFRVRGNEFRVRGNQFGARGNDHLGRGNDFGSNIFPRGDCPLKN